MNYSGFVLGEDESNLDGELNCVRDVGERVGVYNVSCNGLNSENYEISFFNGSLEILQSNSNCDVLFNETSPLNYSDSFVVYSNCDSEFVLKRNDTVIENNSVQELEIGEYNFSVQRNDDFNYSNYFNYSLFSVELLEEEEEVVDSPSSSPSSSSSSTYSPPVESVEENYTIINLNEVNETSKVMSLNSQFNFTINGYDHKLEINNISNDVVFVTIYSEPKTKGLGLNEEWKVNLDSDNTFDLLVKVTLINEENVTLLIKNIEEELDLENNESSFVDETENEVPDNSKKLIVFLIIIFVLLILLFFIILILIKELR